MQLFKYLFIWFNIDVFAALCVLIPTAGSGVEHLSIYISTQSVCGEKCENDWKQLEGEAAPLAGNT